MILLISSLAGCAVSQLPGQENNQTDPDKTNLNIYNYDGGVGTEWLNAVKARFEEKYAETHFADGKTGVNVIITRDKDTGFSISRSRYDVVFSQDQRINSLTADGEVLDISDMVKSPLTEVSGGKEQGSIEDKLTAEFKSGLTALNGKYYALPHYETFSGIFYDKDVFEEYGLYFLDAKLLYRAILWVASKENMDKKSYCINSQTEAHFYGDKYAITNNTDKEQTTIFYDIDNKQHNIMLAPYEILWLEKEELKN